MAHKYYGKTLKTNSDLKTNACTSVPTSATLREAQRGVLHMRFVKGFIEMLPEYLEPESVDVIVSNCVVSLSPRKDKVLRPAAVCRDLFA